MLFFSVFSVTAALATWIAFSVILYVWHYFIEVFLDLPVLGQTPCSAHASLKLLIRRVIQEAIGLPEMEKNVTEIEMSNGEIDESRSYEDLLAAAILNKVVENYQDELSTSRSNSRLSNLSGTPNDKEFYFGKEALCSKWSNTTSTPYKCDTASVSSFEEFLRSESSDHSIARIHRTFDESPQQQTFIIPEESEWQENWLMQKRFAGGRNGTSPVPVSMLVPNPSAEAKVLIGDREADDTTDLSDAGSEDFEESASLERILTNSKSIIGGKNPLFSEASWDEIEESECGGEKAKEEIAFGSFESQTEQDGEYTEKYATLPRTILKCASSQLGDSTESLNQRSELIDGNQISENDENLGEIGSKQNGFCVGCDEIDSSNALFKGTYSEREKQKWNNAVKMVNNPYTSEKLRQRLTDKNTRKTEKLLDPTNLGDSYKSRSPSPNSDTYKARPALARYNNKFVSTCNLLELSSDSDLSVERVYNLASGKAFSRKLGDYPSVESMEKCMVLSFESCSSSDSLPKEVNISPQTDPEISDLNGKRLVTDLLGQYSKSYPNLTAKTGSDCEVENPVTKLDYSKHVHSLTARNIPKEFRLELRQKQTHCRSSPVLYEILSQENMPFPVAKSKIQFFESLK